MSNLLIKRHLVVGLLVLGAAAPARAQIYSWRDANGNLVLSDRPRPGGAPARSYPVPESDTVRATRFVGAERSRLYDDVISKHAGSSGVRADLVRAVVQVESGFNPYATSPKGALGLMQLMPATIERFGVMHPFDPVENVRAGVRYLRQLLDRYQNDEQLALAAYNAGPEAVDRHGQSVPPYRETRHYVRAITELAKPSVGSRGNRIYKVTDIIDGRPVVRYTDKRPTIGPYEIVGTR
jgi:soluble lytic murein transglycosylase-like protein